MSKRLWIVFAVFVLLGSLLLSACGGAESPTEPAAPAHTADALATELRLMADWLGLERLEVVPAGDLGPALADIIMSQPRVDTTAR